MTTEFVRLVRLRPRAAKPRKGVPQTPSRYMFRGIRFDEAKGWYRIADRALAIELRALRVGDKAEGARIFNVCTEEEARDIEAAERRSKTRADVDDAATISRAPAVSRASARANAVTTADAQPEAEEVMIDPDPDGAELEDEADVDGVEAIGRIDDEPEDLGGGTDEEAAPPPVAAPKTPAASAVPKTRKKTPPATRSTRRERE